MPGYERVLLSDPEENHEQNVELGSKESCPTCGSKNKSTLSCSRAAKRDRSLVLYLVIVLIALLLTNLVVSSRTYLQAAQSQAYKQDKVQNDLSWMPVFKSAQAAEYYRHYGHAHNSEDTHETDSTASAPLECEPVPCAAPNITDRDVVKHVSSYTPAVEAIEYYTADFEYDFGQTSTYRGPPTEEREKAWQELYYHQSVLIPTEAMEYFNRTNLEPYQKAEPEKGDGYLAWMEMHRQLGCLNVIREYTWFLAGEYPPERVPQEMRWPPNKNRQQVDHCIETLRQSIMCYGDMTPFLVTKERNPAGWRNDFNEHHTCRNFTKLQEWTIAHGAENWGPEQGHHHIINGAWKPPLV